MSFRGHFWCAYVVLIVGLLCMPFLASACTWTITGGTGGGAGDVGYVYSGWTGASFCAGVGVPGSGLTYHETTVCVDDGATAEVSFSRDGVGEPLVGTYSLTGTGEGCGAELPEPPASAASGALATEATAAGIEWAVTALVGVGLFGVLMHGFSVGRGST